MHIIIALVFLILAVMSLVSTCNNERSISNRPSASISVTGTRGSDGLIRIRNNDSYEWKNVRLYLNSKYEARYPRVPPGEEAAVRIAEFTSKDGTRFNPFTTKPMSLVITADTPNGRASSEVNWQ